MFSVINSAAAKVVGAVGRDDVTKYEWLLDNISRAGDQECCNRYRQYWRMGLARLGPAFYKEYFTLLNSTDAASQPLNSILEKLYPVSEKKDGSHSLQFSFATKLLHMRNPKLPIYDSHVAQFYFFQGPKPGPNLHVRVNECVTFYEFLRGEYERVLRDGLLASAIQEFRRQHESYVLTDQKIVDFLIWGFVAEVKTGALLRNEMHYA